MNATIHAMPSRRVPAAVAALALVALIGACAPTTPPPQQTSSSQPKVAYSYTTVQDLLDVSRTAEGYCANYATRPRKSGTVQNPDGTATVEFTCDQPIDKSPFAAVAPAPAPRPMPQTISYSYRTDQELLDATRGAQTYCQQFGTIARSGPLTRNADGTATVIFDCRPI